MKYPEYDSPFKLIVDDFASAIAKQIDADCWKAVQKVGIGVDRETLIKALKQDSYRYREAFQKGYETGYTKRDEEIIRCKDCKYWDAYEHDCNIKMGWFACGADWFCADGEREVK